MRARCLPLLVALLLAGCADPGPASEGEETPGDGGALAARWLGDGILLPPQETQAARVFPTGHAGFRGEPTLAAFPSGVLLTTAWEKVLASRDGGASWTAAHDAGEGPAPLPGATMPSDPYLHHDERSGRVWFSHLLRGCTVLSWSDDEGQTWTRREWACGTPVVDHQKVASGPPGPGTNPLAASAANVVYLCSSKGATSHCAASYDGGLTWPVEQGVARRGVDPARAPTAPSPSRTKAWWPSPSRTDARAPCWS